MAKSELLSVAEFAERANVSPQSVYKRINSPNNPIQKYVVTVGDRRMINADAITQIYEQHVLLQKQPVDEESNACEQTVTETDSEQQPTVSKDFDSTVEYIEHLKQQIEKLQNDRETADKAYAESLERKDAIIKEQSDRLAELTSRVTSIAEQALQATHNQQVLSAAEKIPTLTDGKGMGEPEPVRRGFLARLFHR